LSGQAQFAGNSIGKNGSYLPHRPLNSTPMSASTFAWPQTALFTFGSLGDFGLVHCGFPSVGLLKDHFWMVSLQIWFSMHVWSIRESQGKNLLFRPAREANFHLYSWYGGAGEQPWKYWKPDTEFMYGFSLDAAITRNQMESGLFKRAKTRNLRINSGQWILGVEERVQVLITLSREQIEFLVGAFAVGSITNDGQNLFPFSDRNRRACCKKKFV